MILTRKFISDLLIGGLLSFIFCALLVLQIIDSGVGRSTTFLEFLNIPDNILFCLLISMFIFASWVFRGVNNRMVLFCWALMSVLSYVIYSVIYDYFYHEHRNIYMLMFAGLAGITPALIIIRYRVFVTTLLLAPIGKRGLFSNQVRYYLGKAKTTDFEVNMETALNIAFIVEFLNSFYLVAYGLINCIPFDGSITTHLEQNNIWDPYLLYYWLLGFITLVYILIIAFYIYRENTNADSYLYGFTLMERRKASLDVLEKYRKKAAKKDKKRRN